ncbi:MAG: hypothetical protein LKE59_06320 [Eubacterium sp.]|jgi:hypothetical protein|nr:hypothetical protein [Eubacterium sp.]MCH4080109.1 hypothetical protein [Eubacterium sp.]
MAGCLFSYVQLIRIYAKMRAAEIVREFHQKGAEQNDDEQHGIEEAGRGESKA